MQLLLVTSCWPYDAVPEFLDDEIGYLADAFDRIDVAPMRPRGHVAASSLPSAVRIDLTLAEHLVRGGLVRQRPNRQLVAAQRALQRNPAGLGVTPSEMARDGRRPAWVRACLLGRADATSLAQWAGKRRQPDLAYTFWLGAATVGLRQAWPTVPIVSRTHGGDLFSQAHSWGSIPFQAQAVDAVDLLASVSERGRAYLAAKFPRRESVMEVHRLGIADLGAREPRSTEPTLKMLSVSSVDANKRVDLICEVAARIALSGRPVRWTHLGTGPLQEQVVALAAARGLPADIRGHVAADEVKHELIAGDHDVFVNLSLSEGAPVSVMEAQCVGMPVVATGVGGTPEVAPARWNEVVDVSADLWSLSEAVIRAAARPREEGAARRAHWARHFDAARTYPAWCDRLLDLISSLQT